MNNIQTKNNALQRLKSRRKLWLDVHLWLGLLIGLWFAIIGLTGSILVFYMEIDAMNYPEFYHVEKPENAQPLPYARIAEVVQQALPKEAQLIWISFPDTARSLDSISISYNLPSVHVANSMDDWMLFINPYTAQVLGTRLWYSADFFSGDMDFIPLMFKLHYALLLHDDGVEIVGILAFLFLLSTLTGLIVWYPLTGKWKNALTLKRNASTERFMFDLHKTSGFYTSLVLIAVLISGISMNLPNFFMQLVELFSPVIHPEHIHSQATQTEQIINWGKAVDIAQQRYPEGDLVWATPAADKTASHQISKNQVQSLNRFVGQRQIFIDQYSGEVVKLLDVETGSKGDVFNFWQWPLHSGTAFGWTGRILVFLSGLACPVLFVTGVIRWLQKRKAKQSKIAR